jgi:isoquinoline 1-oxidoreductase
VSRTPFDDTQAPEPDRFELAEGPAYRFELERREWLKLLGGGLVVGVLADGAAAAQESGRRGRSGDVPEDVDAWVRLDEQGRVSVFTGKAELGQNIRTSLTQAIADELRVTPADVTIVMADTAVTPYDAGTFGSRTTPYMAPQLRRAAAAARQALIDLAAARWNVEASTLQAADGAVRHAASNRSAGYGELTKGERLARVIGGAAPLERSAWRLAGTRLEKVDGRAFVTGQHQFTWDMTRPGMLHGAIVRPSAFNAALSSVDSAGAAAMPGVRVVRDGDFVGVTAPDVTTARRAASQVRAEWTGGDRIAGSDLYEHLRRTAGRGTEPAFASGSLDEGRRLAARTLEATYTVAYIAHVPLEPRAAVAEWTDGGLTVWTGTQRPFGVRAELAEALRVPVERVRVIVPDTGAAYGGKHTGETAMEAARLAKAAGRPVKVAWTREEELTWAYFRPAGVIDVRSGLAHDGRVTFWTHENYNSGAAGIRTPYEIAHQRIAFLRSQPPLRQGSYRALAATANNFARESHMNELADLAGVDPVEFRVRHLADARLKGVLQAAAEKIGWPQKPGAGPALGIACGFEKAGYVGTAVALRVDGDKVVLDRIVCAFDCGAVVNPDGLRNQIEGALVQGIGGALFEAVGFDAGRITTNRLAKYRVPRFSDVPTIETVIVEPPGAPSVGAGETPIIALAPAIAAALFKAAGRRVRSLPMVPGASRNRPA